MQTESVWNELYMNFESLSGEELIFGVVFVIGRLLGFVFEPG